MELVQACFRLVIRCKTSNKKSKTFFIMQKFYFLRYEFGFVLAENPQAASDAAANGRVNPDDSKVLMVVSQKADTQLFPNLSEKEIMTRIVYLQLAIIWTVDDFETRASRKEKEAIGSIYNRKHFEVALVKMIENHHREEGISWATVDYYLEKYCKIY